MDWCLNLGNISESPTNPFAISTNDGCKNKDESLSLFGNSMSLTNTDDSLNYSMNEYVLGNGYFMGNDYNYFDFDTEKHDYEWQSFENNQNILELSKDNELNPENFNQDFRINYGSSCAVEDESLKIFDRPTLFSIAPDILQNNHQNSSSSPLLNDGGDFNPKELTATPSNTNQTVGNVDKSFNGIMTQQFPYNIPNISGNSLPSSNPSQQTTSSSKDWSMKEWNEDGFSNEPSSFKSNNKLMLNKDKHFVMSPQQKQNDDDTYRDYYSPNVQSLHKINRMPPPVNVSPSGTKLIKVLKDRKKVKVGRKLGTKSRPLVERVDQLLQLNDDKEEEENSIKKHFNKRHNSDKENEQDQLLFKYCKTSTPQDPNTSDDNNLINSAPNNLLKLNETDLKLLRNQHHIDYLLSKDIILSSYSDLLQWKEKYQWSETTFDFLAKIRKKARNKIAAKLCRQKKNDEVKQMENDVKQYEKFLMNLNEQKKMLNRMIENQQHILQKLNTIVVQHETCVK
ncbi:hypothetical protein SNEBB_009270 [Seison nebaliae]|nr:hypothetical protein SNEBB_009270 [Seison nebaliae]